MSARLEALAQMPVLPTHKQAVAIAGTQLSAGLNPWEASADTLHIALAATHGMDYLLAWNCKHIANALIRNRIVTLVEGAGYSCPVICTTEALLDNE
jgi:hypothetical protein